MSMARLSLQGKLTITVWEARDLVPHAHIGKMDPYAKIWLEGDKEDRKLETSVCKDGDKNPKWNQQAFILNLNGKETKLHVEVLHKEFVLGSKPIGEAHIELDECNFSGQPCWYKLVSVHNNGKEEGEIAFALSFEGTGLPETHRDRTHGRHSGHHEAARW